MLKFTNIRYLFSAALLIGVLYTQAQERFSLHIIPIDKDSALIKKILQPPTLFISKDDCFNYIDQIVPNLQAKGYISASIDSIYYDSTAATALLYVGELYKWVALYTDSISKKWLTRIGWDEHSFIQQNLNPSRITDLQQQMLTYFENNGYPFSKIFINELQINGNEVSGQLHVEPGPLYRIDSIIISGTAKISNQYLQQYLDIKNGSIYNKRKLQDISNQLKKLNYIEEKYPPKLIWGSTGGIIEVFIDQKKSSQINFLIGFLPNSDVDNSKKLSITGEGLLNLKNAFGNGETIGLIWQKLQEASQQLRINYQQPYLFKSPFGIDVGFNMHKRDSSFLNLDTRLGLQFALNTKQFAKVYVQQFSGILNVIDTSRILLTKQLPNEGDMRITNIGFEYGLNTTNYIFNPVNGLDITFNIALGNKKLKTNNQILELKDPENPDFNFASLYDTIKTKSYQWRSVLNASKYFPLGKNKSTIKTTINGGYIGGSNIFRNELFQIGGYHLLRGFDEQSQFLSEYIIGTLEYRYLIGENSYFNVFTDGGWGKDDSRSKHLSYNYLSAGLGLSFETKVGLFNLAWAIGKRNDVPFNLRQSKIHFGFINYF